MSVKLGMLKISIDDSVWKKSKTKQKTTLFVRVTSSYNSVTLTEESRENIIYLQDLYSRLQDLFIFNSMCDWFFLSSFLLS